MEGGLAKLAGAQIAALRPHLQLSAEAAGLVDGCADVPAALAVLVAGGRLLEATRLIAHALPRREAVWWACMCARHTAPPSLPAPDLAAIDAAELWVRRPSEENGRSAFDKAQQSGMGSPEAWAAVAAFWCGESMSPVGQPAVPPAPHLAGLAVAGAVNLAAVRERPERTESRLTEFIASARDIAAGGTGRLTPEAP